MGDAGPGPTQWGKPALCPSPTSPGKIKPVVSLGLAHYQLWGRQSCSKTRLPLAQGCQAAQSTHLGALLRLPKRLVSIPSPSFCPRITLRGLLIHSTFIGNDSVQGLVPALKELTV